MMRIEPTLTDYHSAATSMDRNGFCQRFRTPVLVSTDTDLEDGFDGFQTVKTSLSIRRPSAADPKQDPPQVEGMAPVISLQSDRPGIEHQVTLGRLEENDLVFNHETVSGNQAIFRGTPGKENFTLENLGSTNPTLVNEIELQTQKRVALRNKDLITIGELVFVFYYPAGLYDVLDEVG